MELKPVSLTAYYTCGIRAEDARGPSPVVGDSFAERCMRPEGWELLEKMRDLRRPWASILARHRLIDDEVRARLSVDPELRVVLIGAGFDTRAFRMPGGRWTEVDEPALIALKNEVLPAADAPRPLERVAVDFGKERLAERLAPFVSGSPALVILEGVLLYLDADQQTATAQAIRSLGPTVTVLCDVMTPVMFKRVGYQTHDRLASLGAPFRTQDVDVPKVWANAGFTIVSRRSISTEARRLGLIDLPQWLLNTVLIRVRDGYAVVELRAG